MTDLEKRKYLLEIAPDFSVLDMVEQAYNQNRFDKLSDDYKEIFFYPGHFFSNDDYKVNVYRVMLLYDADPTIYTDSEGNNIKVFSNTNPEVYYEKYSYGNRYVIIGVLNVYNENYIQINNNEELTKNLICGVAF